jgi:hypothetical protein
MPRLRIELVLETVVSSRGFRSEQAFILAACKNKLERGDKTEATARLEARIAATLANTGRQVQSLFTLVHAQIALTRQEVATRIKATLEEVLSQWQTTMRKDRSASLAVIDSNDYARPFDLILNCRSRSVLPAICNCAGRASS